MNFARDKEALVSWVHFVNKTIAEVCSELNIAYLSNRGYRDSNFR